jgi:hypothetical protein
MEDVYEEYKLLYVHSNKPYRQKMFNCLPAKFVLDSHPPQDRDFRETNLKPSTLPLPGVED